MGDGAFVAVFSLFCIFGLPAFHVWTTHRRKMLELRLKLAGNNDDTLRAAVDQLRNEVRSLRDTATQYDVSFDSALQRIERRVNVLENHAIATRSESERSLEAQSRRLS